MADTGHRNGIENKTRDVKTQYNDVDTCGRWVPANGGKREELGA